MTDKTLKILLGIIAVNLTIQTVKDVGLFPTAYAQSGDYSEMVRAATYAIRNCYVCTDITGIATPNREIEEIRPGSGVLNLTIMHVSDGNCW